MRTRNHALILRLDDSEFEHLTIQVSETDYITQTFLRCLIMGKTMQTKRPEQFADMLRELSAINNNVAQIISVARTQNKINQAEAERIEKMTARIWMKIKGL